MVNHARFKIILEHGKSWLIIVLDLFFYCLFELSHRSSTISRDTKIN